MRIAFCGKGGSGKTTLSSLFIKWLLAQDCDVLAIDGDINQHLHESLDLEDSKIRSLPKLGEDQEFLKSFVKGTNPRIQLPEHIIESTPPGHGSAFIEFGDTENPVWNHFGLTAQNLTFMSIGGHKAEDVATSCYHKFTAAEGVFLNHLLDNDQQYVVGDKVAGADPFASCGIASRYDLIVLVVEPTKRSLEVFHQVSRYAEQLGLHFFVVGNKVTDDEDIQFIKDTVGDAYVGSMCQSDYVRKADKGIYQPIEKLETQNIELLKRIKVELDQSKRDWKKYREVGLTYHKIYADSWGEQWTGVDLKEQIDPDFCYSEVA